MTKPAQYTVLTEDDFIDRYQPETLPDGSYYRHRDWTIPDDWAAIKAAAKENRCWTQFSGDVWCIGNGYHLVNRAAYIITALPYDPSQEIDVMDEEEVEKWEAEQRRRK